MKHLTHVKDADPYFEIRPDTREIVNQSKTKTKIMQHDHNSERFTFSLPRFIEAHDMLECDSVRVHYTITDLSTKESEFGIYEITDLRIDPEDDTKVIGTWLLSQNVTKFAGVLTFVVKCQCYGDDGEVSYSWSTDVFNSFSVSAGIDNNEVIVEKYVDVLEQWKNDVVKNISGIKDLGTYTVDYLEDEFEYEEYLDEQPLYKNAMKIMEPGLYKITQRLISRFKNIDQEITAKTVEETRLLLVQKGHLLNGHTIVYRRIGSLFNYQFDRFRKCYGNDFRRYTIP